MSDNDHIDAQWLRAAQSPPPPPRRRGFGCALSLLVLILVLAGVLFYPRVQALLTPVPTVQIQMESSVLPDTAPNCAANPRVAAVLHAAMRGQTDAVVYDCDAGTLEACMAELLDDPELWVAQRLKHERELGIQLVGIIQAFDPERDFDHDEKLLC